MKKCPQDKAIPYTLVVIVCEIVLFAIIGGLMSTAMFGGMGMGGGAMRLYQ